MTNTLATSGRISFHVIPAFLPVFFLLLLQGCGQPDGTIADKDNSLTPDERYIVELYMKINELEKNLQDNPSDSTKKWDALKKNIDRESVLRAFSELENDPERWHIVYSRIDKLLEREKE